MINRARITKWVILGTFIVCATLLYARHFERKVAEERVVLGTYEVETLEFKVADLETLNDGSLVSFTLESVKFSATSNGDTLTDVNCPYDSCELVSSRSPVTVKRLQDVAGREVTILYLPVDIFNRQLKNQSSN